MKNLGLGLLMSAVMLMTLVLGERIAIEPVEANITPTISYSEVETDDVNEIGRPVSHPTPSPDFEDDEEKVTPEPSYPPDRYEFKESDIYVMAQLLCGSGEIDGDGEYDIDFQEDVNYGEVAKVLTVIMNRVESDEFPNNVYDVITQKNQFTPMPENLDKIPSNKALEIVGDWCRRYAWWNEEVIAAGQEYLYFTGDGITNTLSKHW